MTGENLPAPAQVRVFPSYKAANVARERMIREYPLAAIQSYVEGFRRQFLIYCGFGIYLHEDGTVK